MMISNCRFPLECSYGGFTQVESLRQKHAVIREVHMWAGHCTALVGTTLVDTPFAVADELQLLRATSLAASKDEAPDMGC